MIVGTLTIDIPPGFRASGQTEIAADPGAVVIGSLSVIAGDGPRVIGGISIFAPVYPVTYPAPAVSTIGSFTVGPVFPEPVPGNTSIRGSASPMDLSVRYNVNDMAWELKAAFPANVDVASMTVDLGGQSTRFDVVGADISVTSGRRVRTVSAVHSVADTLTQTYCLDAADMLYRPASDIVRDAAAGLTVDWKTVDFTLSPAVLNYLAAFTTRNKVVKEILNLVQADWVLRPDGSVLVRDTAPDASAATVTAPGQILEYRETELSAVELTGVLAAPLDADDRASVMDYEIVDIANPDGRPEYRIKVYTWPGLPEISEIRKSPLGPIWNIYGPMVETESSIERIAFRKGRANIRPQVISGIITGWDGPGLGAVTFHESGKCVAATAGDSAAMASIVRRYGIIVVRAGSSSLGGALPAGWIPDWSDYDGIHIEIDLILDGAAATGLALVRNSLDGRVADEPVITPNERLLGHVGQRWLRVQNARQADVRIAGWWPELSGAAVDLGFTRIIVDSIELTVRQGRTETRIVGRVLT